MTTGNTEIEPRRETGGDFHATSLLIYNLTLAGIDKGKNSWYNGEVGIGCPNKFIKGGIDMIKRWETRTLSTPKQICDRIKKEMAQPVGIVLFGVDCEFKSETGEEILVEFHGELAWDFYAKITIGRTKEIFEASRNFMVILNSSESADHSLRHQCVLNLKNFGAKTVIGIYAKAEKVPVRALMSSPSKAEFNKRVAAIEWSNPTVDGLDELVVVEEKEG